MDYRSYKVRRSAKQPLLDFMVGALRAAGCRMLSVPDGATAPFRFTFETPEGERMGIVAYAFHANSRLTKNRPKDEHRFQVKYGPDDKQLHPVWTDPFQLYTTLFLGIDPQRGVFVGADPVVHDKTRFYISVEFKRHHVEEIQKRGWLSWERDNRTGDDRPVEVLVGGTAASFLRYVRFEREAFGEDAGHRQLLAERFGGSNIRPQSVITASGILVPSGQKLHALAGEFEMKESEVLDMIAKVRMLKMAVRGWVAEEHLVRQLKKVPGVTDCGRSEGQADVQLRYKGSRRPLIVECKNVLRERSKDGLPRIDLQRTRTSKGDPCSRYYAPTDFDVVAGCLHAVTEKWEFKFAQASGLDPHPRCRGKFFNNVKLDGRWSGEPRQIFSQVVGTF